MIRRLGWRGGAVGLAVVLGCLFAAPVDAQRRQVTIEATPIRGALGYAWRVGDRVHAGIEAGFGFPQVDRTLSPDPDHRWHPDFEEYLHVAALARLSGAQWFEVDTGVRAAIADLWECGASDCWPQGFLGIYAQPMVGWRRFKVGARLTGGWISEGEPGRTDDWTGLLALSPFILRVTFAW